ncbi:hypothetical protein J2W35_001324 [Variovorax boronicumulans]|uniref:HesA/MoeB/ThiF family protein n=1 Tax=Variovorax boronicumulans TaxID=436515 RepID=UPI002781CDD5|nr:ThiF family adenylyltransferase [Variovorax boronicumulans]MDQ0080987.1 hypothetical protein [Variovorax boronicumulans]
MRDHLQRQSFLGPDSDEAIAGARAAVVGLCGGGSHVCQQLAHIGIGHLEIVDFDRADETNRNRMVGLTAAAAKAGHLKTDVIERAVKAVHPNIKVNAFPGRWQENDRVLRSCNVIFGCVDSFEQRRQLELFARRYLIPYIDIGMDVTGEEGRHVISGQIILSLPGCPCMRCMGFLTDEILGKEANDYGAAGGKPQVVWPNGILASMAVGKFMSVLTPWNGALLPPLYSEYDGNRMTVTPSRRLNYLRGVQCSHFTGEPGALGDITW